MVNTVDEAIAFAQKEQARRSEDWHRMCFRFTRKACGVGPSGVPMDSAKKAFERTKTRHDKGVPPRGAPVFWGGNEFGHAALSDGNGYVYSNDFLRKGQIDRVAITAITKRWKLKYLGWTEDINGVKVNFGPMPTNRPIMSLSAMQFAATHPAVKPGTEAQIRLIKATLRVLGCGNDKTDGFRQMYQRFQLSLGFKGTKPGQPADGVPGEKSARRLAARAGYVVVP
jgi:hypothetical protein